MLYINFLLFATYSLITNLLLSPHHSPTTSPPSDAMHRTGRTRAFVVTEQGQPVGVVSLQDICQGNEPFNQPIKWLINPALFFPFVSYPKPILIQSYFDLRWLALKRHAVTELLAHEDRHKRMEMLRQIKENRAFHDALPWPIDLTKALAISSYIAMTA